MRAKRNYEFFGRNKLEEGTYEAVGPHFNGNPYGLDYDILCKHGMAVIYVARDFDSVKRYLADNNIEGLVFWLNGEPVCKIKRSDFGFLWGRSKK